MPAPAALEVELAAVVEFPETDAGDETELVLADIAVGELAALMTPELLTELQGDGAAVPAP
jgi:hypothetical protein